ncbi:glutamine--fructose-6-phosphate transaminase (isomerizing) [Ruminococcus sp.]|uniref:glutamine--fructose-6-phosphate transaminase (isomerizing) n=1 Tax=Ruminococcus sp. TaxID=41978 RepID=UPI0025E36B26|nr:glutamine--fructose-6-phosphate transaminase (isomerizing) [Ruminococcus sp.]MCI6615519.1 glutamine--fructose-6-phosphate transaminase (isomerizing) [Ruminococcus sp.]
MCGIVGYVGHRDCSDVLVSALTKLEYRGYDSAGIAVFENGEIKTVKTKGKLKDLEDKLATVGKPGGHIGIGHTRWATHGEPSDVNSHPHSGARVTIVHNGIIENYIELKEFLVSKGRDFLSDTDTEVVAQLLDYKYNGNPLETIDAVMAELRGSFALGIMFKDFPDRIFAVRRESPLIVGVAEGECFIASDVPAILQYTRDYYLLDHDEIATLSGEGVAFVDEHLDPIEKELKTADWDMEAAEKGGYPHFMIKEINEQPTAIRTTIMPRIKDGLPCLEECGITLEKLKDFTNITIVACGTAMHAGMVGKYVIEDLARVPVNVDIASEFRYRNPIVGKGDLVIIISQSGETADSLAAMRLAKQKGATTLAIVNAKGSSIAREADMLIYTLAGPEIAVASTKAYITQLSVVYLFAFELALAKETVSVAECKRLVSALMKMPEAVEYVIDNCEEKCKYIATKLVTAESLLYIGRGLDYALSMEGSLKLKEVSYIHSESYAAGELKHGTISLIDEDMPVISVATQTDVIPKTISNIVEVKSRGAKIILVCTDACARELKDGVADYVVEIPHTEELLMPITAVVPLQLLAYYTSINRGNDPDKPRNLAKSVTVE